MGNDSSATTPISAPISAVYRSEGFRRESCRINDLRASPRWKTVGPAYTVKTVENGGYRV